MAEAPDPDEHILPLKKLYFNLSQQLTAKDFDTMKELLKGKQLKQGDAEKVGTAMELFNHLEVSGYIREDNLKLLTELFEMLHKVSLTEMVNKFLEDTTKRRKRKKRKKRNARQLSVKASVKKFKSLPKEETQPTDDVTSALIFIAKKVYESVDLSEKGALKMVEDHLKSIRGLFVEELKEGCIECVVTCRTIDALETLWSQYKSGELQEVFQRAIITDELLKNLHAEYITMEVTISEEEYRKCREEVKAYDEYDKATDEANKAIDEHLKAYHEWFKASQEAQESRKEKHAREAAEEEKKKAEQRWKEALEGSREADKEFYRKWKAWLSMQASADDLEAANIQIQTMKADAEEQTEKLSKEMDVLSEQLEIKGGRMQELEAKLEFKSEQEINDEIRKLKSKLESGLTSEDEKGAIKKQISSLENTLREYLALQGGIDSDKSKQEQIQQEREIVHEKADRLNEMQNKVMEGIRRMTLMEHEDWRR